MLWKHTWLVISLYISTIYCLPMDWLFFAFLINKLYLCVDSFTFCCVQGELRPDSALKALTIFEGKFSRLKEERDNVARAKEALELAEPGV